MVTLTNYELSAMIYKGSVAFRPPITRGLAFHSKTNFNIIGALYANTMQKQVVYKYALKIQAVKPENI